MAGGFGLGNTENLTPEQQQQLLSMLSYEIPNILYPWATFGPTQALQLALAQQQANQQAQQANNASRLQIAQLAGSGGLFDALAARAYARGLAPQPGVGSSFLGGAWQPQEAPNLAQLFPQFYGLTESLFGGRPGFSADGGTTPIGTPYPLPTPLPTDIFGRSPLGKTGPTSGPTLPYGGTQPFFGTPTAAPTSRFDLRTLFPTGTETNPYGGTQPFFPGLAGGGQIRPGESALTGEAGPEVVTMTPDGKLTVTPLKASYQFGTTPTTGLYGVGGTGPASGLYGGGFPTRRTTATNPTAPTSPYTQPSPYGNQTAQDIYNLPALQQLMSGNYIPLSHANPIDLPQFGVYGIPNPSQIASTFYRLPQVEQEDYLNLLKAGGYDPRLALSQIQAVTPGFRQGRRAIGY